MTSDAKRKADAKYRNSARGKMMARRYRQSENGKAKYKAGSAKYAQTLKGKESSKRRSKGGFVQRRTYHNLRMEALVVYGGNPPTCVCECGCNQSNIRFLTLDHVNNDGAAHRKALGGRRGVSGQQFLQALKCSGWPKEPPLRVLCYNCNCGRNVNAGICPNIRVIGPEQSRRPSKDTRNIPNDPMRQWLLFDDELDDTD